MKDLKDNLQTIGGQPFEPAINFGDVVAQIIVGCKTKEFDHFKKYELAKRFYSETEVELDKSDIAKLKTMIEQSEIFNSLVLGQLLERLNEEETKPKKD